MALRADKLTFNQRLTRWYWRARDYVRLWVNPSRSIPADVSPSRGPRASILIPVLDQVEGWLKQCVESALNQTVRCQVIVITSSQTSDSNIKLLRELQRNSNLEVSQQQRPGFPAALNMGIALAKTDRIGFLLSDDWLEPSAVEECLRYSSDIVSTGIRTYAADGVAELRGVSLMPSLVQFERLSTLELKARYLQHFFLFQKRKLDEVGGLDETLGDSPGVDDYDLIWVLLEHGATVSIVPRFLYNYRDHFLDRHTLRTKTGVALANLGRMLVKHGLSLKQRQELISEHRIWFGKPLHVVLEETPDRPTVRYEKTAFDAQPFLDVGFSADEFRRHYVRHIPRHSTTQNDGSQWQLSISETDGKANVAVTVDLMLEGDSVFISAVHTSRNAARYSDRIVFNAVLDFALDSGLLTVYSRNSVPEQYSSNRTHARGGEYWKVTVQENSKRIAALEIPASTTTPQ